MIKIRKSYYNAIKKYGTTGVLNMYRDNEIELNGKEWKNLHRRIEKENQIYHGIELKNILHFVICLLILVFVAQYINTTNFENIKKCNKIQAHTCTRYEIEKMVSNNE